MYSAVYLVAISFPAGLLIGLTGVGGAALMTPLLILIFGARPDVAVGTDLVYAGITKAIGSAAHWRLKHVDARLACILASASLPASAVGTFAMLHVERGPHADARLKMIIGVVLIAVAGVLIFPVQPSKSWDLSGSRLIPVTLIYGAVVGFLVGLTSVGSGSLILPFLVIAHGLPPVRAVGTDIFHAMLLLAFSAVLHSWTSSVQWEMIPWLVLGSCPGVILGSRLAPRLPDRALRVVLVLVLLVSAAQLIVRA